MKRIRVHNSGCEATVDVKAGKKKSVWMAPDIKDEKLMYVCADASCAARFEAIDLRSIKLPKY